MKPGRKDPCSCGSGKKYQDCCLGKAELRPSAPTPVELDQLVALFNAGRHAELESRARSLLEQYPDFGFAWKALGASLRMQDKDALLAMQKAAEILADDAEAHSNLGIALKGQDRLAEAEDSYRRALELKPDFAVVHGNLGNTLLAQGRLAEAEASLRRALELKPDHAETHYNLGVTLLELGQYAEAEACYRRALELKSDYAEAHNYLGSILRGQGHLTEAEASYRRSLELKPDFTGAHSNLLFALNYNASRTPDDRLAEARRYGHTAAKKVISQFSAWQYVERPERLRVGLVPGELLDHPVGFFLESLLAQIDPDRIELIAYPTGRTFSALTARIKPHFAAWKPIYSLSDEAAARLIHADGVHVLLDLSGHTANNRLPVFARKPAPVQASWLGYFATTGVAEMDFLLADQVGVPESQRGHFTETIWYLPDTRLCFTPPDAVSPISPLPALQNGYPTFGCFQRLDKAGDEVLAAWATILAALPGAKLRWQCKYLGDPGVVQQTMQRLRQHNIDPARVALHGAVSREAYLAAHAEVDMMLDTFPYPGGTTTCEALWMGVPTLTLAGDTLLARQGASLLMAAGLKDWVATSVADYVDKAVTLAGDLPRLAALRAGLREQVSTSPLFDAPRFARNLENALWGMWQARGRQMIDANQKGVVMKTEKKSKLSKTFLHVGCGSKRKAQTTPAFNSDAWAELRLDIDKNVSPDIVGSMTDMPGVADASVDAVFSSHNIEHLYPHEVPLAIKEFLRVLKPDGFLVVTCPDLQSVCALVAEDKLTETAYTSPAGPIAPIDILYGLRLALAQGNLYMAHRCGFTQKVLTGTLQANGFAVVAAARRGAPFFDLWAVAGKSAMEEGALRQLAVEHFPK